MNFPVPAVLSAQSAPAARRSDDRASLLVLHASKWASFLAGLSLFVAVALIPPAADLDHIRLQRDRILAMEQTDLDRLENYRAMVKALTEQDPATIRLVVASQLQLVPKDRTALVLPGLPDDPRLFELLEPAPYTLPVAADRVPSTLSRLAGDSKGRFILLAIAGLALLWGLLPPLSEPD